MTEEAIATKANECAYEVLDPAVVLLAESQLAFVGGGIGTVTVA